MSFIVTFKTNEFVVMAGDKRVTFVNGEGYKDGSKKVYKMNDYIYGTTGSGELGDFFDKTNKAKNLKDFINFSNDFFDALQQSKEKDRDHWIKQRFDLTLQIAGILDNKTYVSQYQIRWDEDGILFGVIPKTVDYPCFVMPAMGDGMLDYVENYIKSYHPDTIEEARMVISHLMKVVSDSSDEVSPDYDVEFLLRK